MASSRLADGCRSRRRRGLVVVAATLLTLVTTLLRPDAALAHAVLEATSPAGGSVAPIGSPPHEVRLTFDEPVEVGLGAVRVVAADGKRVDLGQVRHPNGRAVQVATELRAGLGQGTYLVMWRVVSADSHPVAGSFTFSVGRPGAVAAADAGGPPSSIAVAVSAARFADYAAMLVLVGALAFAVLCWRPSWTDRRWTRLVRGCLLVGLASTVARFGLQAAYDLGAGFSGAWDAAALRALGGTRFGRAEAAGALLFVALAVLLSRRRTRPPGRLLITAAVVATTALLGTVAAGGHAGTGADAWWRLPLDVTHLAAAGAWIGGLATLLVLAIHRPGRGAAATSEPTAAPVLVGVMGEAGPGPGTSPSRLGRMPAVPEDDAASAPVPPAGAGHRIDDQAIRRFSTLAAGCVGVLVASGVVQAWYQVREWDALAHTHYGRLLIVKTMLVAVILIAALFSRARLRRARADAAPSGRLVATVGIEAAVAVGILAVTSVLVAATPARAAYRPAVERTVQAGPVTVQLSTVPTGTRTVDLHVYVFDRAGLLAGVDDLRLTADRPGSDREAGTVVAPLQHVGSGHFVAPHWLLPAAGTWRIQLSVRVSDFDAYTASTNLSIR
jgi:copper transport protein